MIEENSIDQKYEEFIIFHYDIEKHRLPYIQFYSNAQNTKKIIDDFNAQLFGNSITYELYVAAPKKGGFVEFLLPVVAGGTVSFILSEAGRIFIKELTGYDVNEVSKKFAISIKDYLKDDNSKMQLYHDSSQIENKDGFIQFILSSLTKAFLEKTPTELKKIGISPDNYRNAFDAKNNIYRECIKNTEIKAIEFNLSYDFKTKYESFREYIVELPEEIQEPEDDFEWKVGIADLVVYSPVWKRDNRNKPRLWKADTKLHTDISFEIEDEMFWHKVKTKSIDPDFRDNMKVQWMYPDIYDKPTHAKVLKVISYNGYPISNPYSGEELKERLNKYKNIEKDHPDLFD